VTNKMQGGVEASRKCPSCHSNRLWQDGKRKTKNGFVQRYICRDCDRRFSESSVLSMGLNNSGKRQVCAVLMEAKNLAKVEPLESGLAGATTQIGADIKSRLLEFTLHLKREGDTEATILTYGSLLKKLLKLGADLLDPDTIKDVLAEQDLNQNTKASIVAAYTCFLKFLGLSWVPPKCRCQQKIPFIPLESEIDDLIAGCSKTISAILELLKETGMRIGEANSLEWTDIDLQRKTVVVNTPEKHGNPRILKISTKLIAMVQALPKKCEKILANQTRETNKVL
jgi:integrase